MKRNQYIIGILFILVVITLTFFWQKKQSEDISQDVKVVGIATLMSHQALDAVQENLKKELEQQGFSEGVNIKYVIRNANGQVQIASNIANELSSKYLDVIVAITTPMAQAVVKASRCPVVFSAVTDPVGAGLVSSLEDGEEMITGTSDAWPYEDQLKLIHKITPNVKTLGVLYNPGEAASQYGIKEIRKYAPAMDFTLIEGAVNSTNEVYPVAQNIIQKSDAIFLSSDNTVIGGVAAAVKVCIENKKPLYVGDSGTVANGGLAAVSVGYEELGRETGKLVARVLRGERHIPTVVARGSDVYLNTKAAELMGVSIPDDILKSATTVYKDIE